MPPRPTPLSLLFREQPPDAGQVAFGLEGARSFADLTAHAAALAAAVQRLGAGRWLLDTESAYAAAVGLFALAWSGSVAVLPTNRQPETLRRLRSELVGAVIDPARDASALGDLPRLDPLAQAAAAPPAWRLDRDAPFAEFETSGTTGEGRWIPKALRHLEDEVLALEAAFGARLPPGTQVFATVSHQHIYGLLFRVLWPLSAGRPFHDNLLLHPQELFPRMLECQHAVLVTTPVHLRRMAASQASRRWRPSAVRSLSLREGRWRPRPRSASPPARRGAARDPGLHRDGRVAVRERSQTRTASGRCPAVRVLLEPADDGWW